MMLVLGAAISVSRLFSVGVALLPDSSSPTLSPTAMICVPSTTQEGEHVEAGVSGSIESTNPPLIPPCFDFS